MAGLKRRYSRVVYDMPEQKIRLQLGLSSGGRPAFSARPMCWVWGSRSPRASWRPGNVCPRPSAVPSIERPCDVDVVINGAIAQRLRMKPGNYSIRDVPLAAGADDRLIIINDEERRTVMLSTFADARLLAIGQSEWAASGACQHFWSNGDRAYRQGDYLASAAVVDLA